MAQLINKKTKQVLAKDIIKSRFFLSRLKGLIGKTNLDVSQTFWIKPCNGIHTFFMSFNIDIIFVNYDLQITGIYKNIPPFRLRYPFIFSQTYSVFEFKTPALQNMVLQIGDQLYVDH